jgi:predicted dehydrogenase
MAREGRLGVGIVGLGLVGVEHARAYLASTDCEIRAVVSRDGAAAKARAESLGINGCTVFSDLDQMLKRPDIDIVSVCTPNNLHVEQGIAVAQAGKHLVMEKPIALDIASARKLEKAVAASGVKNVVCFVLHWYPRFVNQKALVKAGAIGKVFMADCEYLHGHLDRYESQWRWIWKKSMGGSTLLQGGVHAVDAMRQFMEAPAVEVTAYSTRRLPKYEYDPTICGLVRFADGAIAKLTSTFETAMPYQLNLRLYGSAGTIQNGFLWSEVMSPQQNDWASFPAIGPDSGDPSHHPFRPLVDTIVRAVKTDTPAFPDIADAIKSHEIVFAADRSAAEHATVSLPL